MSNVNPILALAAPVLLALALTGMSIPVSPALAASSQECDAEVRRLAISDAGAQVAAQTYAALNGPDQSCGDQALFCAGQIVSLRFLEQAYASADEGSGARELRLELETAQQFGAPWQVLVGIADLSMAIALESKEPHEFQRAARSYQDAINVIGEAPVCQAYGQPPYPGPEETRSIHNRMTEALMLAPQLEVVRTRAGTCGGIFLSSVRGFTPTFRPLPINFEFGSAQFTDTGEQAARVLLECVLADNYNRLSLSGHTDPIGSDAYNLALSERRLEAVAKVLREGGYEGELELLPRGEAEPFEPDDPTAYSEDELHQMDRRVVLLESQ
ncbi:MULTISPECIES: OmpA family protein [Devosia]|uniref:OmpA family protein n=1 Tax=Devosia TaxID=46913 RepID=UPI001300BBDC|nr:MULTISPECIES: OmpA family protein [Devosia]